MKASGFQPHEKGSQITSHESPGLDHYRHSDWLGSDRLCSSASRTVTCDIAYGPYGETYASSASDYSFTGMNQDTAANMYDFPAREYGPQGRWPSPDPAGIGAVDPTDPQTWNRYAYVGNNPLAMIDPAGTDGFGMQLAFMQEGLLSLMFGGLYGPSVGWFGGWSDLDIVNLAFTPKQVITGWQVIGVDIHGDVRVGGCPGGDSECPFSSNNEVPVYGTVYPYMGLLNLTDLLRPLPVPPGPHVCETGCHFEPRHMQRPLRCDVDLCTPEQKKEWCAAGKATTSAIANDTGGDVSWYAFWLSLSPAGAALRPVTAPLGAVNLMNGKMSKYFDSYCSQ